MTWSSLARNTGSTATRRHTGLTARTTRHYRVSAINSYDTGAPSNVASATTEERVPDPPTPPTRLTARARGTSTIDLDWTAPSSVSAAPITGYRIEVSSTGNSRWTALEADTDSRATDYRHTGLNPGTTRHYRVAAINRVGRSAWSSVVSATTDVTVPGAPSGLRAVPSGLGGSNQLRLTWTRPSTDGGKLDQRLPDSNVPQRPLGLDPGRGQHPQRGHDLPAQRSRPRHHPLLPRGRDQRPGAGGVFGPTGRRNHQRRAARPGTNPERAGDRTEQHHPHLGGAVQRRRGPDHRLLDPGAKPQRRHVDHDPEQYGFAGDHFRAHRPPAGNDLSLPGPGDQLRGTRPSGRSR